MPAFVLCLYFYGLTSKYNMGRHDEMSRKKDFRVYTQVYRHGRLIEIESKIPLNPKVRKYLKHRMEIRWTKIDDGKFALMTVGHRYNAPNIFGRKVYCVPYTNLKDPGFRVGSGMVLIFDQFTGALLYDGDDGGE